MQATMNNPEHKEHWTEWAPFPDPNRCGFIYAPFGPGVYELRRKDTGALVLRGKGRNCAYRMASLLPYPLGQGTRHNVDKRNYILKDIDEIEYRCCACKTESEACAVETKRRQYEPCIFNT